MSGNALLIGPAPALRRLERQLDLLDQRPVSLGWVVTGGDVTADEPLLGTLDELESVVARRRPTLALVTLPAAMSDLLLGIRTRLRRLGVPDRFMPTLEDQLAGIGPRTEPEIDLVTLIDRPRRAVDASSVRPVVEGRRVLITGAGGSIGGELARVVAGLAPERLVLMDRSENALFEIDRQIARIHPDVTRRAVLHDVVDAAETRAIFGSCAPHVVIHAAAHKHVPMMEEHPAAAVDNNLFGTRAVADAADLVGAERFVMISTDKAVNPSSIMGATKRLAEMYVQDLARRSGTACSMVRFGNVLGSSGSVLDVWARQIADGGPVTVTDAAMTRYFMTIPEAAVLVLESAALVDRAADDADVFLLDMGAPVRILDLARRFVRAHGLEPAAPEDGPVAGAGAMPIVLTGARPGEKLHEELSVEADCMVPTGHPDVARWKLAAPTPKQVDEMLTALDPERTRRDAENVIEAIWRLVPERARPVAA
jgi:FlaA1/EpsC-like NDP-sugar epimerase